MYSELFWWMSDELLTRGAGYSNNYLVVWFRKFKIKRRTVAAINRIKSGHTSLRESLFCFGIVDSPLCVRCDVCETPNHFGNVVLLEV